MSRGGGDGGAAQARADEQARQARIREGTSQIDSLFGQNFNDDFYGGRRQAYLDYAAPQLNDQYAEARKQLLYSLDRSGTLDSSVRAAKEAELQKLYDTNRRAVADQGLTYENQARTNIENARADLIRTLSATGDSQGAVNQALSRSAALSQPDSYSPLGDLFSKFTGALGQQAAWERAGAMSGGAIKPAFNTGLFGASPGAVKVT